MGSADGGWVLFVGRGIEQVEVVDVESQLHLIADLEAVARVNAGNEAVLSANQVQEDLVYPLTAPAVRPETM